jgi:phenylpropionate dioxygenase-like ring-hydroxylating dioxygenase large terminal subunit
MSAERQVLVVPRVDELVGPNWVDGRIYTDAEIYRREMRRVFMGTWLYVGHESEIPTPGDYVTRFLAGEPVILVRSQDEQVRVLLNRCRHRGNLVCQYGAGNSQFFRCQYHGWTYSNVGNLIGVPYPNRYQPPLDRSAIQLTELPLVDSYRGFVFASFKPGLPPLTEHLGAAAELLDVFVDQSPEGEIELRAGVQKSEFLGNWKFVGMDGYHANFVHKSVASLQALPPPAADAAVDDAADGESRERDVKSNIVVRKFGASPDREGSRSFALGNGHVRLDSSAEKIAKMDEIIGQLVATPAGKTYFDSMVAAYGRDRASRLLCTPDPHVGIFPNLQVIGVHVRIIEPIAADRTVVQMFPAVLRGAPEEINTERIRRHEWFYSPAGFGSPDDYEIFERNQMGLLADLEPNLILLRGYGSEREVAAGVRQGAYSDELTQREQLSRWADLMADDAE